MGTREYCMAVSVCMYISGRRKESGDVAVGRQLVCVLVCVCAYLHAACVSFLCIVYVSTSKWVCVCASLSTFPASVYLRVRLGASTFQCVCWGC